MSSSVNFSAFVSSAPSKLLYPELVNSRSSTVNLFLCWLRKSRLTFTFHCFLCHYFLCVLFYCSFVTVVMYVCAVMLLVIGPSSQRCNVCELNCLNLIELICSSTRDAMGLRTPTIKIKKLHTLWYPPCRKIQSVH